MTATRDCGILYVATGSRYIQEAAVAVKSARQRMPTVPIALFTDATAQACSAFTDVFPIENPSYSFDDKIRPLAESPYERTLYLDTDTLVAADCHDVFTLLDHFDIAIAHAPCRFWHPVDGCPESFPEMNTGVMALRKGARTDALLRDWQELYHKLKQVDPARILNQSSFRLAAYRSEARIAILPPEYNFRTPFPCFAGGRAKVKIFHGRDRHLADMPQLVNSHEYARVFLPNMSHLYNADPRLTMLRPSDNRYLRAFGVCMKAVDGIRGFKARVYKTLRRDEGTGQ